jgi:hypothetical protein
MCSDEYKIVVDYTIFDESTLAGGDELRHSRPQLKREDLCEQLGEEVDKANGAELTGMHSF